MKQVSVAARNAILLSNGFVLLVPLVVIAGWITGNPYMTRVVPTLVQMNPLTAVLFISLGFSYLFLSRGLQKLSVALSLGAGIIVFIRMAGFYPPLDIHIDQLLFSAKLDGNRMAPNTTLAFFLCSLSLLLSGKGRKAALYVQALALFAFTVALLALIGYIYNALSLYQVKTYIPMALHTAICFLVLTALLLFHRPGEGFVSIITSDYTGGRLARTLLTIAILMPVLFGWLRVVGLNYRLFDPEFGTALLIIITVVVFGAVIFYQANLLNKADMDRQNVQEQLIKAKEVAEYAREVAEDSRLAQEQFLANMSHELRTPLNSMLILSRLLSDNAGRNLTEKQVEYSKVINKAGSDLLALINDILDLSKINSGKMELLLDQVSVPEIQNTVSNLFSPIALQKEIALSIHVDREVPDYICTDETRLGQILKNLLSNAFKFTEKGGQVSLRIQRKSYALNGNRKESCIAFAVGDTGIGIPEDKRQHIFDAFRQVDGSTSRKYGGTGLGLSISSKLVQLLGGTILLESELGRGSTFTILLPESPKAES